MFAYQLISNEMFALKPSDSASSASVFMEDWQVKDLPVVQNGKLIGTVNEKVLFDNEDEKVANILNSNAAFCFENTHFYDLLKLLFIGNISAISVLDKEQNFKGIIAAKDLAKQLVEQGFKGIASNLPPDCGVTPNMMPKYCYYKPASDKRGDKFIIERHPKLVEKGLRQWATTEAKTKTTKQKFDLMIAKLIELEN